MSRSRWRWRTEDEALLSRLEDEIILERLWSRVSRRSAAGGRLSTHAPNWRAAALVTLIGKLDSDVRAKAVAGDVEPLARWMDQAPLDGCPPELLHHLALYLEEVAAASEGSPDASSDARGRSLAAWLALARPGPGRDYLRALAEDVAGASLPAAELERAVDSVGLDVIDALAREAREGTRGRTNRARAAWRTLARVPRSCREAGLTEEEARQVTAHARKEQSLILESALAPIAEAMADASARGTVAGDAERILRPAASLWSWTEYDEAVERFVVDQVSNAAWELYRDSQWDRLRALIGPLDPLVDSLCDRIATHHEPIGYLAACAHMLVFRAETATTLSEQIAHAERALALYPAHRNAQIVLCNYLCRSALHRMDRPSFFVGEKDIADIEATLVRAEALNATSRFLGETKQRLAEYRRRRSAL